jgi:multidrug efflux system membrane fusion protein
MRRSWLIAIGVALATAGWVASGWIDGSEPVSAGPSPAPEEAPLARVRTARVSAEPMTSELILQGRTQAERSVVVRAETHGRVEEVLAARGARVEAGDLLVRLAVEEREARVAEKRALVRQREIEFEAARSLNERGYRADTQLAEAQALLDAARAELRLVELDLENLEIRAPFAGVVDDRPVEVGDVLAVGDPVATVVDLDPLRIVGQVAERYLGRIERGATGTVRLVGGAVVEGRVTFVGSVANENTRTFPVELEVPNPDGRVIQGLTAELRLPIAETMAHRLSPAVLTLDDEGRIGVKAVDDDGRVVFHPVQIVGGNADGVWLGGLPPTLDLIVVGQDFVVPGQAVEAVPAAEVPGATLDATPAADTGDAT